MILQIHFKSQLHTIELPSLDITLTELKKILESFLSLNTENQRLVFGGRVLKDDQSTLLSYKISPGNTIYLVEQQKKEAAKPVIIKDEEEEPENPMDSLMNKMISSNPELLKSIFLANPHFKSLLEQNPELGQALKDPSHLKQIIDAHSNPKLKREMMRQQDRMLANIQAMPEGFQALQKAYKMVEEPLRKTQEDFAKRLETPNYRFLNNEEFSPRKSESPNTEPLPNPWEPNRNESMNRLFQGANTSFQNFSPSPNSFLWPSFTSNPIENNFMPFPPNAFMSNDFGRVENTATNQSSAVYNTDYYRGKYSEELKELEEMGFNDVNECIKALLSAGGNMSAAIQRLLQESKKDGI
ncbi:hypothetical protein ROZALSC1DRAFT_29006 [Rozella allomycis CSF55]|uniref:Ubiquilin domain-containing protein n=1 Tax=Rozella allomycis (strain CSF55) TaxID=988480 RepID=A0A4P9YII2_ROZAC|nr:hypothetical protein ROZALSC1DRAFT_29006 [Rozella allomycis CSF55]